MGIVLFTTVTVGALLPTFTRFVGLEIVTDARNQYLETLKIPNDSYYVRQIEEAGLSRFHKWWNNFDERWLRPYFGGESEKLMNSQRTAWENVWNDDEESVIQGDGKVVALHVDSLEQPSME
jgi:hypothetical protein